MKFRTQTYILLVLLIVFCINGVFAVHAPSHVSKASPEDTVKIAKLVNLQEKIKLIHRANENQVRIETDFPAADPLTAEIINMIGVSCLKTNFRASTTIDYTLKPGIYFVVVYLNHQRIYSSKILVSQ